jgi:hypothetical protein
MKYNTANWITVLTIVLFIVGFFVLMTSKQSDTNYTIFEGMEETSDCPDLLVQQGPDIVLLKSTDPSNNVMKFSNMDEYQKYMKEQSEKGEHCPVLFLKKENNTQGQDVYRMYRSPTDPLPITPPSSKDGPIIPPPFSLDNARTGNAYPGFDAYGMDVGIYTDLDKKHDSTQELKESENPMDPNWGGVPVTQNAVDTGKYKDNEIVKISYTKPMLKVV